MGVLQDFERRLEGVVEGFFARAFRSGLQPVELAKAIRRYAEDTQHVTEDGVLVPNVYRFRLNPKDLVRFSSYGDSLRRELAEVVARSAENRDWLLRGPVLVRLQGTDEVSYGMFELAGRVETVRNGRAAGAARAGEAGSGSPRPAAAADGGLALVPAGDTGDRTRLTGTRLTVGRLGSCDVVVEHPTVSREHAVFVRRGDDWWVVDLGSTNGTRVNGHQAAEQQVGPGDRVELGEAVLDLVGS